MGRTFLCPPWELARALQEEEGGRTRESGRKGGGGTRLKGNMPGERGGGEGGETIGDRETDGRGSPKRERHS